MEEQAKKIANYFNPKVYYSDSADIPPENQDCL